MSRSHWIHILLLVVKPVFQSICDEKFKTDFPPLATRNDRAPYSHLEALGRSAAGIAPWLELQDDPEAVELAPLVRKAIKLATDPSSSQYMVFKGELQQPLVDASYVALAMLRAPKELWTKLDTSTQANVIAALKKTRDIEPNLSNWVLFASLIEAFFYRIGAEVNFIRLYYAVEKHREWYLGDGVFGDGPHLAVNYYNSFVIQPYLYEVMAALREMKGDVHKKVDKFAKLVDHSLVRSAEILEQVISPDGSYPAVGRSIVYRCGAFQTLALVALLRRLPSELTPGQVRTALTRVINQTMAPDEVFDEHGWLRVGLVGYQPHLAQYYINVGSLYMTTLCFLPLGLPASDEFWTQPDQPTSWEKMWRTADRAL